MVENPFIDEEIKDRIYKSNPRTLGRIHWRKDSPHCKKDDLVPLPREVYARKPPPTRRLWIAVALEGVARSTLRLLFCQESKKANRIIAGCGVWDFL